MKYYERNHSCIITFTDGNLCLLNLSNLTQEIYKCQQAIYDLTIAEKYKKFITLCRDSSLRVSINDYGNVLIKISSQFSSGKLLEKVFKRVGI